MNQSSDSSILYYYTSTPQGGLAEYSERQIAALLDAGCRVKVFGQLKENSSLRSRLGEDYCPFPGNLIQRVDSKSFTGSRYSRAIRSVRRWRWLARQLEARGASRLLIGSFEEYWSPFWCEPFKQLKKRGLKIGILLHDPIRDFVIGPVFFHNWCLRLAFSLIDVAFVHDPVKHFPSSSKVNLNYCVVPHGIYEYSSGDANREAILGEWNLDPQARYLLCFGHIRDDKNLDLVLNALRDFPQYHLIVAGREQSSSQKPVAHYKAISNELGIADRCHWFHEYIPDSEVWKYFRICDVLLLTYSQRFNSASGVLNTAAHFQIPVIGSSGSILLKLIIEKYGIGIWISPDSVEEIKRGLEEVRTKKLEWGWKSYRQEFSWQKNAQIVINTLLSQDFDNPKG